VGRPDRLDHETQPRARKRAQEFATVAVEHGVAAACVYRTAQAHPPALRQVDIAAAAGVSRAMVRDRRKDNTAQLELP